MLYQDIPLASVPKSAETERAEKKLVDTMNLCVFGEDYDAYFVQLKQLNRPTHICGHVFAKGEPTYQCRLGAAWFE